MLSPTRASAPLPAAGVAVAGLLMGSLTPPRWRPTPTARPTGPASTRSPTRPSPSSSKYGFNGVDIDYEYDLHGAWNEYAEPDAALHDDGSDAELARAGVHSASQHGGTGYLDTDWAYHYVRDSMPAGRINIGLRTTPAAAPPTARR